MANINVQYGRSKLSFRVGIAVAFLILFVYLRLAYNKPLGTALEHHACKTIEEHEHKEPPIEDSRVLQDVLAQPISPSDWQFNTTRDERVFGLSSEQCDAAFPGLFYEITRAAKYRNDKKVTNEDLDIAWAKHGLVRAMIVDQQLYIIKTSIIGNDYDVSRALSVLHAIHRAIITSRTPIPDIEFTFSVDDKAEPLPVDRPIWAFTRRAHEEGIWLMSDFGYWSWASDIIGSYEQIRNEIKDIEIPFAEKKQQLVWRGSIKNNACRKHLVKLAKNKDWADVKGITWKNAAQVAKGDQGKVITLPDHCLYQYVLHTEGISYSGRGKYLQNCNSVVIIPKPKWIEPHHALLNNENYVEVKEDFSDLEEKVLELQQNSTRAEGIARAGVEIFRDRYLTPAAQNCYWRKMMHSWAEISFQPKLWELRGEDGKRRMRGTPFETFVVQSVTPITCPWFRKLIHQC